ncbi:hypothetical protein L6V77_16535 [Myxococcota bacterium]|jgi:hypothetical protein|nr:hypothetical protein [Myxococcota bacterium]
MLDIHLAHVRGAEEVLLALRDPNVVLEKVARLVGQVPPLAERLRLLAAERAQRPVRSGEQAVLMLGCTSVEQQTRGLVDEWLAAMEQGGARIVPFPTRTTSPALPARPTPTGGWRRAGRGA